MSNCEHVMEGPHQHACSPTNIWTKRSTSHHRVDSTKQLSKAAGNDTANIHFTTIMIAFSHSFKSIDLTEYDRARQTFFLVKFLPPQFLLGAPKNIKVFLFFHGFHNTEVIFLAYYPKLFILVATHSNFLDAAIF